MKELIRKARKNYTCVYCEEPILKNNLYKSIKGKSPRFEDEKQIGISYFHERLHDDYIKCNEMAFKKGIIDCLPWEIEK